MRITAVKKFSDATALGHYYPTNVAKALLLQTYVDSSNRLAEGFLLLFQEKLGISSSFSYKTIERGYDRDRVNEILDEIIVITNESVGGKEETFSFDGTGFSASNKENYADK
jgi:transposase